MPGDFVDCFGKVLGQHKGIINYTVGQRKGLGLSFSEPKYVKQIDFSKNRVVLAGKDEIYMKKVVAKDINLIMDSKIEGKVRLKAKTRYRQREEWATVFQTSSNSFELEFDRPQLIAAKGQAVVLYFDDVVFGGGTII